jgi:DNA-binding transcriptional MerR regulator
MGFYSIGDIVRRTGLSHDTLRYYERIGLLRRVGRDASGRRVYDDGDLSDLRFIRRAQAMGFSLEEIGLLLQMRTDPRNARAEVRELTAAKLAEIERRLQEIETLRNELRLLLNLCRGAEDGCPIIESLGQADAQPPRGEG